MNHTKYAELLDRVEEAINERSDWAARDLAVAVVQALLPELDHVQEDANIDQTLHSHSTELQEIRVLLLKTTGNSEKLAELIMRLTHRVDALELAGKVGASLPKDWTIATIMHSDSNCHVCKSPKRACRCPTL